MIHILILLLIFQDKPPDKKDNQEKTREQILDEDIKDLISKLTSDNDLESFYAKEELTTLGKIPKVTSAILAKYKDSVGNDELKVRIRHSICEILGDLREKTQEVTELLKLALKDYNMCYGTSIASIAVSSLTKLGCEEVIPEFIKMLDSAVSEQDKNLQYDFYLQYSLIKSLGILRAKDAPAVLKKYLSKKDKKTSDDEDGMLLCAYAAEALGKIRDKAAIEELVKYVDDSTEDKSSGKHYKWFIARALERITGETKGTLTGATNDVNKTLEEWKKWGKEKQDEFNVKNTKAKILKLEEAIKTFEKDQNRLPHNLIQLKEKPQDAKTWPEKGYWQEDFKDSWGTELTYNNQSKEGNARFDIISYGSDTKPGGLGNAMDIYNHKEWERVRIENSKKILNETADALDAFKKDNEQYPKILQDLITKPSYAKKWKDGGYIKELPKDGFGNLLVYTWFEKPGTDKKPYELKSLGYDNIVGGKEEVEKDLALWDLRKVPE